MNHILLKETTKWLSGLDCNGIYILNEKPGRRTFKAIGYISPNTDAVKWLSSPLDIDMRGREFKMVSK